MVWDRGRPRHTGVADPNGSALTKLLVIRVGELQHLFVIETVRQSDELDADDFELRI